MSASGLTPLSGRFLLDTNIIIAILNGDDSVLSNMKVAAEVYIPAVALGELYFGAAKSGRPESNCDRVDRFAESAVVLGWDLGVARVYGMVKDHLRRKGRPIPENDVWIAAIAIHHGLILVTRDGHYEAVDGLATVAWMRPAFPG